MRVPSLTRTTVTAVEPRTSYYIQKDGLAR
jgi:hypothetical protein